MLWIGYSGAPNFTVIYFLVESIKILTLGSRLFFRRGRFVSVSAIKTTVKFHATPSQYPWSYLLDVVKKTTKSINPRESAPYHLSWHISIFMHIINNGSRTFCH